MQDDQSPGTIVRHKLQFSIMFVLITSQILTGGLVFDAHRNTSNNEIDGVTVFNTNGTKLAELNNQCTRTLLYAQQTCELSTFCRARCMLIQIPA